MLGVLSVNSWLLLAAPLELPQLPASVARFRG
jgi:hypothetical protein